MTVAQLQELLEAAQDVIRWAVHDIPSWALFRGHGNERIIRLEEALQTIKKETPS